MRTSTSGSTADTLQFFGHEEGRVRYTPPIGGAGAHFDFDYMFKDHLGNVRMLLTEETKQDVYPAATLEGNLNTSTDAAYIEKIYYTIDPTFVVNNSAATNITTYQNNNGNPPYNNNPNSNTTANSAKLYQMNSGTNKIGLSMSLKVMAGDTINIFGRSYFYVSGSISDPSSAPAIIDLLTAFAGSASMTGKGITGSDLNNIAQLTTGVGNLMSSQGGQTSNIPKAYINWIFFDERFNYAGGSFDRVGSSGNVKPHSNTSLVVPKNGYVFVFCTNESPHNVFFDNLQVIHSRGPIIEETHYYPFGLTMSGISSRASSFGFDNKNEYNGKERQEKEFVDGAGLNWYDFGARMYDVQIGRWHVLDAKASKYHTISPYNFCLDNPINVIDPDGNDAVVTLDGNEITISSTIYVYGKKMTKEKARQLQKWFNHPKNLAGKAGKYKDKDGKEYTIRLKVKIEYDQKAESRKLKEGENIMNFTDDENVKISSTERGQVEKIKAEEGYSWFDKDGNPIEQKDAHQSEGDFRFDGILKIRHTGQKTLVRPNESDQGVMHEVMHLFGLSDRYDDANWNGVSDIMQNASMNINQTHYNNWGTFIMSQGSNKFTLNKFVDLDPKSEKDRTIGKPIK